MTCELYYCTGQLLHFCAACAYAHADAKQYQLAVFDIDHLTDKWLQLANCSEQKMEA
jgi:hypothetical protein